MRGRLGKEKEMGKVRLHMETETADVPMKEKRKEREKEVFGVVQICAQTQKCWLRFAEIAQLL